MAKKKVSSVKAKVPKERKVRRRKGELNLVPKEMPKNLCNPKTRAAAINAMCWECIYDPNATGSWRAQVEACTAPKCPLFNFRPKTVGSEVKDKAVKKAARKANK